MKDKEVWKEEDFIFKIEGKTKRCINCPCNVFRKNEDNTKAKCNSCGTVYEISK